VTGPGVRAPTHWQARPEGPGGPDTGRARTQSRDPANRRDSEGRLRIGAWSDGPDGPVRSSSGDSELGGVTFNTESEWHESRVTSQGPGERRAGPGVARVLDPGGYVTGQLMGSQIKTKIFAESLRTIVERLKSRPKKYWNSVQPGGFPLRAHCWSVADLFGRDTCRVAG
jgi:hypothetical protein